MENLCYLLISALLKNMWIFFNARNSPGPIGDVDGDVILPPPPPLLLLPRVPKLNFICKYRVTSMLWRRNNNELYQCYGEEITMSFRLSMIWRINNNELYQ